MRLKILLIYTFLLIVLTAYYTSNYTNISTFSITNNRSFLTTFHTSAVPQNSLGETVVAAQKMNTLYIGVDNPLTIVAENMDAQHLKVTGNPISVKKTGKTTYNASANRSGKATITIEDTLTHQVKIVHFDVKHLPCPTVKFGGVRANGGRISKVELQTYQGLVSIMEDVDFDAQCSIIQFRMTLVKLHTNLYTDEKILTAKNNGANFNKYTMELIAMASAGDRLYINDVWCKCPSGSEKGNNLTFQIT